MRTRKDELAYVFYVWMLENPSFWAYFERTTLNELRGRRRFGARAIVERARWEEKEPWSKDGDFKLPDKHISNLARFWNLKHPDHAKLFRLGKLRSEDVPAPSYNGPTAEELLKDLAERM